MLWNYLSFYIAVNLFWLCEGNVRNLAVNKPATQSSLYIDYKAERAVDGVDGLQYEEGSCSHTAGFTADPFEPRPWWQVDLLQDYHIKAVAISHINCDPPRLVHDFSIEIYKEGKSIGDAELCYYHVGLATKSTTELYMCKKMIKGRYVRITINGTYFEMLILCEVRVVGSKDPTVLSFSRFEGVETGIPDMTYSVQGYGQCAMKCYVLPMCRIFSVKSMSNYYQCDIFTGRSPTLVANSTGSPTSAVFIF